MTFQGCLWDSAVWRMGLGPLGPPRESMSWVFWVFRDAALVLSLHPTCSSVTNGALVHTTYTLYSTAPAARTQEFPSRSEWFSELMKYAFSGFVRVRFYLFLWRIASVWYLLQPPYYVNKCRFFSCYGCTMQM